MESVDKDCKNCLFSDDCTEAMKEEAKESDFDCFQEEENG